jgi:hypothetical protein
MHNLKTAGKICEVCLNLRASSRQGVGLIRGKTHLNHPD